MAEDTPEQVLSIVLSNKLPDLKISEWRQVIGHAEAHHDSERAALFLSELMAHQGTLPKETGRGYITTINSPVSDAAIAAFGNLMNAPQDYDTSWLCSITTGDLDERIRVPAGLKAVRQMKAIPDKEEAVKQLCLFISKGHRFPKSGRETFVLRNPVLDSALAAFKEVLKDAKLETDWLIGKAKEDCHQTVRVACGLKAVRQMEEKRDTQGLFTVACEYSAYPMVQYGMSITNPIVDSAIKKLGDLIKDPSCVVSQNALLRIASSRNADRSFRYLAAAKYARQATTRSEVESLYNITDLGISELVRRRLVELKDEHRAATGTKALAAPAKNKITC